MIRAMVGSSKRTTERDVRKDWEAFIEGLEREVAGSHVLSLSLYDAPDGVLKRGVYQFVRDKLKAGHAKQLDNALDSLRTALRPKTVKGGAKPKQIRQRKKPFAGSEFYYALREVPSKIRRFRGDELSRFGRQLSYAYRHDIEPDLLIGFLAQTGTGKEIADKVVKDANGVEAWYADKQEAATLAALKKSHYPLAILTITATSNERDSCPLEIGFAKARGREAPISDASLLIRPDPSWGINAKWNRERERETKICIDDLRHSDTAKDIIMRLAELSEGLSVVHCEDVGRVSHWLDMLISSAEVKLDFQLRDVGDFLDHDANKRAELRRRLEPIPTGVGSARIKAQQLCNAVRMVARH
jgi:hypothetical protein